MTPRPANKQRKEIRTVLIVGEGYAEYALLEYLKGIYHVRGSGFTIKLNNARGKGAAQVIDHAIGQKRNIAYDVVAVLFDTDKDWHADVRQRAKDHSLLLFPCEPCLEAELLRTKPQIEVQGTTEQIKRHFLQQYQEEAHKMNYFAHFPADLFEQIKAENHPLKKLIKLIRTGQLK